MSIETLPMSALTWRVEIVPFKLGGPLIDSDALGFMWHATPVGVDVNMYVLASRLRFRSEHEALDNWTRFAEANGLHHWATAETMDKMEVQS